eukprot:1161966-Amphidinium_carterae.1
MVALKPARLPKFLLQPQGQLRAGLRPKGTPRAKSLELRPRPCLQSSVRTAVPHQRANGFATPLTSAPDVRARTVRKARMCAFAALAAITASTPALSARELTAPRMMVALLLVAAHCRQSYVMSRSSLRLGSEML